MTVVLHPPEDVSFGGDPISAEEQERIAGALRAAVRRAVENAASARTAARAPDRRGGADPAEAFDPARADRARGVYLVPSYADEGELTGVKLLELIPKAAPGYDVGSGPSPLEGGLIMELPGLCCVNIRSPRYVTAGTLGQALLLGLAVFGTTSFAVLQGPWGSRRMRYWAVGTDPAVTVADLREQQVQETTEEGGRALPAELEGKVEIYTGEHMESTIAGRDGEYLIRGFITKDRAVRWKTAGMAAVWFAQLQAEQQRGVTAPPTAEFARLVFADIDRLVARVEGGDTECLQRAAELLSRLDWVAFGLVDWPTKVRYLKVLLAAWTRQEEETAVVQIFKSLRSGSEVDAIVGMLRQAGRYDQLFDDLDNELYDLLTTVGESFSREHGPLRLEELAALMQSMGLTRTWPETVLDRILADPSGAAVPQAMLDEAHDAVMGFVRFGAGLGESIATIFTDPEKVFEGLLGLAQLIVKVELAGIGYLPCEQEIARLLAGMGEKILAGMRGADRLGCGEKVTRRIRWRLVWEIASFFVGVGEIKAVAQGLGIAEKLAGVVRILAVLARLGEAADAEVEGVRLARLAAMLKAGRTAFTSAEEAASLLSRLPERDVARLGKLVSRIEIREGESLAELAARSPELHAAVEDAAAKAELLKTMASRAEGLSDEIVRAFQALAGDDGPGLADAQKIVKAIPEGEGARFAATLNRIPLGRIAEGSRAAFLEVVAASPRRMEAVAQLGADTFTSVYRRAAGRGELVDQYLGALDEIEGRLAGQPGGFRQLLDRIERDDPASWLEVESTRRVRAGERAIGDWAQQLGGSPKAQRALDRLLRRGQDGMVDSLIGQLAGEKGLISDPDVVLALEEMAGLGDRELDGMLELKRYVDRAGPHGNFPEWDEILFTEPGRRRDLLEIIADLRDPASPADLVVADGMADVVNATLRHGANIQGGLGHLEAARSLLRDFPGARFRFEVTALAGGVRRDVDIVVDMRLAGRQVDVEVKGYKVTTGISARDRGEISRDLLRHLGDPGGPWSDLLWRFADPGYAGNVPAVRRIFGEELEKLAAQGRLPGPLATWQARLAARFADPAPWTLVDVLH